MSPIREDEEIGPLDELVLALPPEKSVVAFARALRDIGVDYEFRGKDGDEVLTILSEDDADLSEFLDRPDFLDAYADHLADIALNDFRERMVAEGYLKVAGVDEHGRVLHTRTDESDI